MTKEMTEMDLDAAIESGDADAIEAAMAALEAGETPESTEGKTDVAEGQQPEASASSSASEAGDKGQEGASQEEEPPSGIASKKGDRVLPYSELEAARESARVAEERAAGLEKQINELRSNPQTDPAIVQQLEKLKRTNELYQSQLEQAGIEAPRLPEEFRLDADKLKELSEYGEVGQVVAALAQQNAFLLDQMNSGSRASGKADTPPPVDPNDAQAVVAGDPDLTRWSASKYAMGIVQEMDEYVATLPEFQGKTLADRKDKVVELTRQRLGEPVKTATTKETPEEAAAKAQQIVDGSGKPPTSLSEISGSSSAASEQKTLAEQMAGLSEVELAEFMDKQMKAGVPEDVLLAAL